VVSCKGRKVCSESGKEEDEVGELPSMIRIQIEVGKNKVVKLHVLKKKVFNPNY
jgi:hypothetical protein